VKKKPLVPFIAIFCKKERKEIFNIKVEESIIYYIIILATVFSILFLFIKNKIQLLLINQLLLIVRALTGFL